MIISHTDRYVFVECPRTGSTAVRRKLRELYDGTPILHKREGILAEPSRSRNTGSAAITRVALTHLAHIRPRP